MIKSLSQSLTTRQREPTSYILKRASMTLYPQTVARRRNQRIWHYSPTATRTNVDRVIGRAGDGQTGRGGGASKIHKWIHNCLANQSSVDSRLRNRRATAENNGHATAQFIPPPTFTPSPLPMATSGQSIDRSMVHKADGPMMDDVYTYPRFDRRFSWHRSPYVGVAFCHALGVTS